MTEADAQRRVLRFVTRSEAETIALGRAIAGLLRAGDVLALHGDLGAGKTRLVRGIAEGLGVDPALVSSPTYTLMNEYPVPTDRGRTRGGVEYLAHLDAYRLVSGEDVNSLGMDRLVGPGGGATGPGVVVIEWAARILESLPGSSRVAEVTLTTGPAEELRCVVMESPAEWAERTEWRDLASRQGVLDGTTLPDGWQRCPVSGAPVSPECPTFPFANEKCRMADLGRWMSGDYVVSRELRPDDEVEPDDRPGAWGEGG